jgi:DNA-binding transcriptional LysR family regulator
MTAATSRKCGSARSAPCLKSPHGTFAEASRSLGMATPSVWRQVRALEDDYGVQLVTAKGHDVRLTEDGERLLDLAAPLVEGFDSLKKVFHDQHGKAERHLRMAAPATVLNSSLRHVIARYRESHPQVRLSLIDAPSRIAWQLLEAEKADLAIVGHAARRDAAHTLRGHTARALSL